MLLQQQQQPARDDKDERQVGAATEAKIAEGEGGAALR